MKTLSRSELKNVMGGLGGGWAICTFCASIGCNLPSITYDGSDSAAANDAQAQADKACYANDCCENVDCPGAD
jgi:hypothetical protein